MTPDQIRDRDVTPDCPAATMIGVTSRMPAFRLRRAISGHAEEPRLAISQDVVFREFRQIFGVDETALAPVSGKAARRRCSAWQRCSAPG